MPVGLRLDPQQAEITVLSVRGRTSSVCTEGQRAAPDCGAGGGRVHPQHIWAAEKSLDKVEVTRKLLKKKEIE